MASNVHSKINLAEAFQAIPIRDLVRDNQENPNRIISGIASRALASGKQKQIPLRTVDKFPLTDCLDLSKSEQLLLQVMFKRWPLSQSITLLSLFGVDLHSKISNLSTYLNQKQMDKITAEFSCLLFNIYNTYERDERLQDRKRDQLTDFYFPPIQSIQKSLGRLQQDLSNCLALKKVALQLQPVKRPSPQALKKIDELVGEYTRVEKGISQTIALLVKILASENSNYALLKMNLRSFEETESLNHLYGGDTQKTLQCLKGYINYCESLENWNRKKGKLHVSLSANWWPQLNHLLTQAKPLSGEAAISEIKLSLHQRLTTLESGSVLEELTLQRAKRGTLTHAGWLASSGLSSRFVEKSQEEFIEVLLARKIESNTIDFLLSQFSSIFEFHVITPNYPKFSTNSEAIGRFMICVSGSPMLPEHLLIPSPDNLTERFENYFSELIAPIEQKYSQALFIGVDPDLKNNILDSLESVEHGNSLAALANTLRGIGYDTHAFKGIKLEVAAITSKLSQFLEVERAALPLDISEAEIKQIVKAIKKICFTKSLFAIRLIMAIEDADTILTGVFTPGLKHIPPEVSDLVLLDNLEEWIRPPSPPAEADPSMAVEASSEEKSSPEQEVSTSQSSDDEKWPLETVEEPPQAAPHAVAAAAEEPVAKAAERIVRAAPPRATARQQPAAQKRASLLGSRSKNSLSKGERVLELLAEYGFTLKREGARHHIFSNKTGVIIPVRRGSKDIPKGTMEKILKQVEESL